MRFREFSTDRLEDFRRAGYRDRHFFPHRVFYLPKSAPDAYKFAYRSGLHPKPDQMWEVVLFALPSAIEEFPTEMFFDDEILWHRQQFGLEGQVAVASMTIRGSHLSTSMHHSDLVQRISRRRQFKTRVEKVFAGWDRLLLNSILRFALERGLKTVRVPTAAHARGMADTGRDVQAELFERIYDRHVCNTFDVRPTRDWWVIDIAANRDRIVAGTSKTQPTPSTATICLCHDIELGLGHRSVEPAFADIADAEAPASLDAMLEAEHAAGIRGTYNVVGSLLPGMRGQIEPAGHTLGFHTFDHDVDRKPRFRRLAARALERFGSLPRGAAIATQLGRCRRVDRRIKGYRAAQSWLGADTDPRSLSYYNFEWLASSVASLGIREPEMDQGVVKIPILFDDFVLHRSDPYDAWEARALEAARTSDFLAFSLHDCYGDLWLDRYPSFLRRLQELGEFKTLDEVAAEVTLTHAV